MKKNIKKQKIKNKKNLLKKDEKGARFEDFLTGLSKPLPFVCGIPYFVTRLSAWKLAMVRLNESPRQAYYSL
jgi:hypothetical protein